MPIRLAFLCVLLLVLSSNAFAQDVVTDCDRYAASDTDPGAKAPGVPFDKIDSARAIQACNAAVQQFPNSARLQFQLARAYQKGNNFNLALEYYRKAAAQNYAAAQNNIGHMYADGQGVPADDKEAVAWYLKAAEQGLAAALNNLGIMYWYGRGVPRDDQQAVAWFSIAADQGLPSARSNLGTIQGHSKIAQSPISTGARPAGEPIMAIVALRNQLITVYDANGWIMLRAPVSSGQRGRETPAGIFSVIQKEAEHYSNIYDDAYMPHMQRITWSGIALHGGQLPGYPASHGCIRMPYDFAERLFNATWLGMRVIVAPTDVAPIPITHPALFPRKSDTGAVAAARAAEADEAASNAGQARLAAATAAREAARAMLAMHTVEIQKLKADAEYVVAEPAVGSAGSGEAKEQGEDAKAKAAAKVAKLEAQLVATKAELQRKLDAAASAREATETATTRAAEAARRAARDLEPISVFISRKTQRLYVRQAFQPLLEVPVTIRDADRPIGTHVFTVMERTGGYNEMRWSVVSLNGGQSDRGMDGPQGLPRRQRDADVASMSAERAGAKAALDRLVIPEDTLDRIAGMISPRSSLIISDEALSSETGDGTEFVILMRGEPQGGLKNRRRGPESEVRYKHPSDHLPYPRSPFADYSTW
jgi:TPR repeat protein